MAFGIKIGSSFLDIDEGSQLTFEINTELWVTGEPSISTGSYSFPIDLPLTNNNKYLLRFPDRIDAHTVLDVVEGATVYIGQGRSIGLPVFTGRLFVKGASNSAVKVFLVVEGLSRQNERKIKDVDLGVYDIGGPVTLETLMNGTRDFPLNGDFVFPVVWNDYLFRTYTGTGNLEYIAGNAFGAARINHYGASGSGYFYFAQTDLPKRNNLMIVPMLRLEVVLERIVEAIGYTLINEWIGDNEELRSILIFNNKSINDLDVGHKKKIRYNEHLPAEMLVTELLKQVSKFAFCGLFVNHTSKTITMRPYRMVLNQAPRHYWTDRATVNYEIEQDNVLPTSIGYDNDPSDAYFDNNYVSVVTLLADGAVIADYWENGGNPNAHGLIDGYYRVKRDNSIMRYDPSKTSLPERWSKFLHRFAEISIGGRGSAWRSKVIPMFSDSGSSSVSSLPFNYSIPRADIPMNIDLKLMDDEVINHRAELSNLRLMIYRGIRSTESGHNYPYANATAYDPATETESFNHSLHLDGDKGMYIQYGREWIEFMRRKKIVKRYLLLTLQDILNIREYDKVRIDNMDYFIKTIRVSVNHQGIGVSECTLVTIPFSVKFS